MGGGEAHSEQSDSKIIFHARKMALMIVEPLLKNLCDVCGFPAFFHETAEWCSSFAFAFTTKHMHNPVMDALKAQSATETYSSSCNVHLNEQ